MTDALPVIRAWANCNTDGCGDDVDESASRLCRGCENALAALLDAPPPSPDGETEERSEGGQEFQVVKLSAPPVETFGEVAGMPTSPPEPQERSEAYVFTPEMRDAQAESLRDLVNRPPDVVLGGTPQERCGGSGEKECGCGTCRSNGATHISCPGCEDCQEDA